MQLRMQNVYMMLQFWPRYGHSAQYSKLISQLAAPLQLNYLDILIAR
jgi:hypothetical protein